MMIHFLIAWRNLWQKKLQTLLTMAVVATSVALCIVVMLLAGSIQKGLIRAADPFDLIVGAKGSPNQLVLNTVFLQDVPLGNIDYSLVGKLQANPLVQTAIPLGFGDNYHGYRIVGTERSLFQHRSKAGANTWMNVSSGREFQTDFEAVIGAKTAQELNLKVGDQFASSHGVVAGGEAHKQKFTVVGILEPLHGPYDQAIFVPLASIWNMHGHHEGEGVEIEHHDADDDDEQQGKQTTVILVKPKGYAEAMKLYQDFYKDKNVQLIFPAQVVVQLFAALGEGEKILKVIGYAVFAMALLLVAFSLYWSSLSRSRDRAILRAIGGSRQDVFRILLLEGIMLVWSGVLLGVLLGHGIFSSIAALLEQKTAVMMSAYFATGEFCTVLVILLAGIIAGLIPAVTSARSSIAEDL